MQGKGVGTSAHPLYPSFNIFLSDHQLPAPPVAQSPTSVRHSGYGAAIPENRLLGVGDRSKIGP